MRRHNVSSRVRGISPKHSCRHQTFQEPELETAWSTTGGCRRLEARSPGEGNHASRHHKHRPQTERGKDCRGQENAVLFHLAFLDALKSGQRYVTLHTCEVCIRERIGRLGKRRASKRHVIPAVEVNLCGGIFLARAAGHAAGANRLARVSRNTSR